MRVRPLSFLYRRARIADCLDKWLQCILWDFPEGYRLYEHIKSKADGQTKPVKNHSGGGHDRQDAYLYGHPKGPKKRFRSPGDFFPHLLWLATDDTSDPDNCTCKLCSPFQLEPEKPAVKVEPKAETPTIKQEDSPAATPPVPAQLSRPPVVQAPVRRPSAGAPSVPSPTTTPAVPTPARPLVLTPTPLPQPRTIDQQVDAQYGKFLARIGEVTWFHRDAGAWGLGIVVRRWIPKDGSTTRAYLVQPLSYPFDTPAPQIITDDSKLKPWLAWSAPQCTYVFLQQNPQLQYEQVDWPSLRTNRYGEGNAEVDASILAAKAIDVTYTLFERTKTQNIPGYEERHWNGIYLGAEKIYNGEPVRLHLGSATDILVITDIVERVPLSLQQGAPPAPSTVHFIGDIYSYSSLPAPDPNAPPEEPPNQHLPIRMREDMRWRNRALVPNTRTLAFWKLLASQVRLDISEIKGRWYETSLIFVNFFNEAMKKKENGNGIWMNSRGDCVGITKPVGVRIEDRINALGAAVPKGTILVDGLEAPRQEEQQNKPPTTEMEGLGLGLGVGAAEPGFALDDFLHGMEGDAMTFDDQFTF